MYTIREPNSQWFSPRFFARLAANFSAMRQHAEKIICDPDKKPAGENCFAPMGKNFCEIFSFAKAGRLMPANDKNGKIARKIAHRHCGVRFSYGIANRRLFAACFAISCKSCELVLAKAGKMR